MNNRIEWIDTARGLCMSAILLFHTEIYYTGSEIINYSFYVNDVLITFFFISGYLIFNSNSFSFKYKIKTIIRTIVFPYFIFATIIALPKAIVHDNYTGLNDLLINIISGHSSWFVTTLAVANILLVILYNIAKKYSPFIFPITIIFFGIIGYRIREYDDCIWNYNIAFFILPFIYAGHLFKRYFNYVFNLKSILILFSIIVCVKYYIVVNNESLLIYPIAFTNLLLFIVDCLLCTIFIIEISKRIPKNSFIVFLGKNSLVS